MKPKQPKRSQTKRQADAFQQQAEQGAPNFFVEFFDFLLHNKKWWLIPIVVVLLALGAIAAIGGSGLAPFIYTLW